LTQDDAKVLSLGLLLHRVTQLRKRDPATAERLRDQAEHEALQLSDGPLHDVSGLTSVVRHVANTVEDADALNLANVLLHLALLAGESIEPVEVGRILAQRARIARKAGALAQARTLYEETLALGNEIGSDELVARAHLGFGLMARARGNLPEDHRQIILAAEPAQRSGVGDVKRMVHQELMVLAALRRDFDEATLHAWAAFRDVEGDSVEGATALVNMGQALLDAGRTRVALRVFSAGLSRNPPTRLALPMLGGAARAAALLERHDLTRRFVSEIDARATGAHLRPEAVSALGEAARALAGFAPDEAEARRQAAHTEAVRSGFHQIVFELDRLETQIQTARPSSTPSVEVERVIEEAGMLFVSEKYAGV
jgi:tetratricopeptide (TPR) repeat protein